MPVFTFWQPPFSFVNVNIRPSAPAGQPASSNIVTQWPPDPLSTWYTCHQHGQRVEGVGRGDMQRQGDVRGRNGGR